MNGNASVKISDRNSRRFESSPGGDFTGASSYPFISPAETIESFPSSVPGKAELTRGMDCRTANDFPRKSQGSNSGDRNERRSIPVVAKRPP